MSGRSVERYKRDTIGDCEDMRSKEATEKGEKKV